MSVGPVLLARNLYRVNGKAACVSGVHFGSRDGPSARAAPQREVSRADGCGYAQLATVSRGTQSRTAGARKVEVLGLGPTPAFSRTCEELKRKNFLFLDAPKKVGR